MGRRKSLSKSSKDFLVRGVEIVAKDKGGRVVEVEVCPSPKISRLGRLRVSVPYLSDTFQ